MTHRFRNLLITLILLAAFAFTSAKDASWFGPIGIKSPSAVDEIFSDSANIPKQTKELLSEARNIKSDFWVSTWDAYTDQLVVEHALPNLLAKSPAQADAHLFVIGPHQDLSNNEPKTSYSERWLRIFLTFLCWIGVTFFFKKLSLPMRVLLGVFITSWGVLLLSLFSGKPTSVIYEFWVPLSLIGLAVLLIRSVVRSGQTCKSIMAHSYLQAIIAFLIVAYLGFDVFSPFLQSCLNHHDARLMWFIRYKFAFMHGFNPEMIAQHMPSWSQPDYPWFLAGSVGIASWRSNNYAGWHENAAYGSLLIIALTTFALWLRFLKSNGLLHRILILLTAYLPMRGYVSNGYMDGLWIPLFALFIASYYERKMNAVSENSFTDSELWLILAVSCSLKNDAIAATVMFLLVETIRSAIQGRETAIRFVFGKAAFYFSCCIPVLIQKSYLARFNIHDQYSLSTLFLSVKPYDAIKRFESLWRFLFKELVVLRPHYTVCFAVLLLVYALSGNRKRSACRTVFDIILLTFPAMLIYTYTPYDQDWHLMSSAFRVFMVWPFVTYLILSIVIRKPASSLSA